MHIVIVSFIPYTVVGTASNPLTGFIPVLGMREFDIASMATIRRDREVELESAIQLCYVLMLDEHILRGFSDWRLHFKSISCDTIRLEECNNAYLMVLRKTWFGNEN